VTYAEGALWGLFGGLCVEAALVLSATLRHRALPWHVEGEMGFRIHLVVGILRMMLGAPVAAAAANEVGRPLGALLVGAAAPLVVDRVGQLLIVARTSAANGEPGRDVGVEPIPSCPVDPVDAGGTATGESEGFPQLLWLTSAETGLVSPDTATGNADAN
jgi:hypothetical protein